MYVNDRARRHESNSKLKWKLLPVIDRLVPLVLGQIIKKEPGLVVCVYCQSPDTSSLLPALPPRQKVLRPSRRSMARISPHSTKHLHAESAAVRTRMLFWISCIVLSKFDYRRSYEGGLILNGRKRPFSAPLSVFLPDSIASQAHCIMLCVWAVFWDISDFRGVEPW